MCFACTRYILRQPFCEECGRSVCWARRVSDPSAAYVGEARRCVGLQHRQASTVKADIDRDSCWPERPPCTKCRLCCSSFIHTEYGYLQRISCSLEGAALHLSSKPLCSPWGPMLGWCHCRTGDLISPGECFSHARRESALPAPSSSQSFSKRHTSTRWNHPEALPGLDHELVAPAATRG